MWARHVVRACRRGMAAHHTSSCSRAPHTQEARAILLHPCLLFTSLSPPVGCCRLHLMHLSYPSLQAPHRHAQRFVSMVIPDSVTLTVDIYHHRRYIAHLSEPLSHHLLKRQIPVLCRVLLTFVGGTDTLGRLDNSEAGGRSKPRQSDYRVMSPSLDDWECL